MNNKGDYPESGESRSATLGKLPGVKIRTNST